MTEYRPEGYSFPTKVGFAFRFILAGLTGTLPTRRGGPKDMPPGFSINGDPFAHHKANKWLKRCFDKPNPDFSTDQIAKIQVTKVTHYKDLSSKYWHEFVLVTLLNTNEPNPNDGLPVGPELHLRYERIMDPTQISSSLPPSSTDVVASSAVSSGFSAPRKDLVEPLTSSEVESIRNNRNLRPVRAMAFNENPNILDLAAVLEVVSKEGPVYRRYTTMCFWFAGTTYDILYTLYSGVSQEVAANGHKAGMWHILRGYKTVTPGYEPVEDAHKKDDSKLEDAVKDAESRGASKIRKGEVRALTAAQIKEELDKLPMLSRLCDQVKERRMGVWEGLLNAERTAREQEAKRVEELRLEKARADTAEAERQEEKARADAAEAELRALKLAFQFQAANAS